MKVVNKKIPWFLIAFLVVLGLIFLVARGLYVTPEDPVGSIPTNQDRHFGVSAGSPLAVSVGMKVLEEGGNAIDAAVAVSYALGTVQPYGSGIGGGGAMLVYPSDGTAPVFYDYQGVSPLNGLVPKGYVAVPGFVLAMEKIHGDLGTLPMDQLIAPSIMYAKKGFPVDATLDKILRLSRSKLAAGNASIFYNNGSLPGTGMVLTQPELAATLSLIQKEGSAAFYNGVIARDLMAAVPGLAPEDLAGYRVSSASPVSAEYGKYVIFSAPPPFGGVTLIQILKMAEQLEIEDVTTSAKGLYTMSRILNTAYSKRLSTIADPGFSAIDAQEMVSSKYIDRMVTSISQTLPLSSFSNEDTTHFVIIDKDGMMVSCTNSLSSWFGSGISIGGFFLNNHLRNFSQNTNNLNGWEAGKRPRTFMSPTIIALDGKPILGIGTPGGNRIPAVLSQVLITILINGENPQTAIDAPRFYINGSRLFYEKTLSESLTKELNSNGITVSNDASPLNFGAVNCLYYDPSTRQISGAADSRRGGAWSSK